MTHPTPDDHLDVIVIGAGQAGLAVAAELRRHDLRYLVLEAASQIGHSWRSRWDSLRLFSPAQYDGLPGMAFPAPADTYPTKDDVADYLAAYASHLQLPVLLDCAVERLERRDGRFVVHTTQGTLRALQVVVATGPFQAPVVPSVADGFSAEVTQLHSSSYRNPTDLPDGPVLVVGGGNSGLQIAEELAFARPVVLATGAPSVQLPQRFLGRDLFWWMSTLGIITRTADSRLARRMRAKGDLVIGTTYRSVARAGVAMRPRLVAASGDVATFEDGSTTRPAAVVWATGFRRDYRWIDVPGVVVDGEVVHRRGVSDVPGLSFIGLPWQHTRGSALLGFVQEDARWLAREIASGRTTDGRPALPERAVSE